MRRLFIFLVTLSVLATSPAAARMALTKVTDIDFIRIIAYYRDNRVTAFSSYTNSVTDTPVLWRSPSIPCSYTLYVYEPPGGPRGNWIKQGNVSLSDYTQTILIDLTNVHLLGAKWMQIEVKYSVGANVITATGEFPVQ